MKRILFTVLGLALIASSAQADIVVSENFDDGTLGTLIQTGIATNAGVSGNPASGSVVFAGGGDGGRSFVGTSQTDFGIPTAAFTGNFSASIDVTIQSGGGANGFIGFGPGVPGGDGTGGGNAFGEPTAGPAAFVAINANNRAGGSVSFGDFGPGTNNANSGTDGSNPVVGDGSHTITLDFDALTGDLTFSAIVNGAPEITLGTIDTSDNGFDSTTTNRIFFGGDDGTTFDNFTVSVEAVAAAVPEPGSAALLGLGVLGSMIVRRRRR